MDTDPSSSSSELSKNQLKNEAKRRAKLEKFQAKQAKLAALPPPQGSKESSKPAAGKKTSTTVAASFTPTPTPTVTSVEEKRKLSMPSAYDPSFVEAGWARWWEDQGLFKPSFLPDGQPSPKGTYVLPIPPPNVTGSLHLGHALTISIQDTLVRYQRMLGKTVLYNPGCDHAGIATQSVVERKLWRDTQRTRHDLGRSLFLEKVWEWKNKYGERIYSQLRRLGVSCDWSRATFTMDPKISHAVTHAFLRLHKENALYRATRLVNWCSHLSTALSNLEVENKELQGQTFLPVPGYSEKIEFGTLVFFAYPLRPLPDNKQTKQSLSTPAAAASADNDNVEIVVATTRLETMLGDVAVAVHPDDERYRAWIGRHVVHPFFPDRVVPVVGDTYVDPAFGTGAVKITPAHDINDFEIGRRHNLPMLNLLNDDGTLNAHAGPFQGLPRFAARAQVLAALKERGLFRKSEPHAMVLPTCSRSGDIIEPRLKPQWYVRCTDMAQRAMQAVHNGHLTISPKTSEKEWFRWLENIQDWCISRQLWWGHRVPAYAVRFTDDTGKKQNTHETNDNDEEWVVAASLEDAQRLAKEKFPERLFTLHQDEDVLDTWFSSGLWPFAIHGWPEKNTDMAHFYPASLLETGWDILFFWVARMVMLGLQLTDKVPFQHVFCHAMVRDAHGRKMSKSLGNVIDPIDVLEGITLEQLHQRLEEGNLDVREREKAKQGQRTDFPNGIPACGADALRFALCAYTSTGRDLNLDILRVEGYRKFCNKVWQATRFALTHLSADVFDAPFDPSTPEAVQTYYETLQRTADAWRMPEQWILAKLNHTVRTVRHALDHMQFMVATSALHQFWLYDVCDVFLELCKRPEGGVCGTAWRSTLYVCFDHALKLLHPFMPFLTEELWQRLPTACAGPPRPVSLVVAPYPAPVAAWEPQPETCVLARMDMFLETLKHARSLTTDYAVQQAHLYVHVPLDAQDPGLCGFFETLRPAFLALLRAGDTATLVCGPTPPPAGCITVSVSADVALGLMVRGFVDVATELQKLTARLNKIQAAAHSVRVVQAKPQYVAKVKPDVRAADDAKLKTMETEMERLTACMESFLKLEQ